MLLLLLNAGDLSPVRTNRKATESSVAFDDDLRDRRRRRADRVVAPWQRHTRVTKKATGAAASVADVPGLK
jgi:hypothetical protein